VPRAVDRCTQAAADSAHAQTEAVALEAVRGPQAAATPPQRPRDIDGLAKASSEAVSPVIAQQVQQVLRNLDEQLGPAAAAHHRPGASSSSIGIIVLPQQHHLGAPPSAPPPTLVPEEGEPVGTVGTGQLVGAGSGTLAEDTAAQVSTQQQAQQQRSQLSSGGAAAERPEQAQQLQLEPAAPPPSPQPAAAAAAAAAAAGEEEEEVGSAGSTRLNVEQLISADLFSPSRHDPVSGATIHFGRDPPRPCDGCAGLPPPLGAACRACIMGGRLCLP
jgi:hypothetical protein